MNQFNSTKRPLLQNFILMGPPGCGKGTQGDWMMRQFGFKRIGTGDLLRNMAQNIQHPRSESIRHIMKTGGLVPDEVVSELVVQCAASMPHGLYYFFDGFPRNKDQADFLIQHQLHPSHVVVIEVPDPIIVHRLSGRRVHSASGRIYHITDCPPQHAGIDDITQEPLIQREDDQESVILSRLLVYHQTTTQLFHHYQQYPFIQLHRIHGDQSIEAVFRSICQTLGFA